MGDRLHTLAPGLWTLDGDPISFLTFPYTLRSTIVRLEDGSLLVHSPVQWACARGIVERLGPVAHLVSPNKLHHLFLDAWTKAYPKAHLWAPPGLRRRRPDLPFHAELGDAPDPAWASVLDQRIVRGSFFMEEVVFFHRASRTLLLGDLIENHDPAGLDALHRMVARANRMLAPHGTTPVNYRLTFWRRAEARRVVHEILAWEPRRVIVMHGPCVEDHAGRFLLGAFAWLVGPNVAP